MTRHQLAARMAKRMRTSPKEALRAIAAFETAVAQALCEGDEVRLNGFGRFRALRIKPARRTRIHSGKTITQPALVHPRFKPGNRLVRMVRQAHPAPHG